MTHIIDFFFARCAIFRCIQWAHFFMLLIHFVRFSFFIKNHFFCISQNWKLFSNAWILIKLFFNFFSTFTRCNSKKIYKYRERSIYNSEFHYKTEKIKLLFVLRLCEVPLYWYSTRWGEQKVFYMKSEKKLIETETNEIRLLVDVWAYLSTSLHYTHEELPITEQ